MFLRSTGLGRTLLTARVAKIETTSMVPSTLEPPKNGTTEPLRMLMTMEVVNPVHWTVRAFVDPSDLRCMVREVLTHPGLILKGILFLCSKDPAYGAPATTEQAAAPQPGPTVAAPSAPVGKTGPGPIPASAPKAGPGPIPARKR
jgi:hypothetical protein